ncbi:hypothetical protein [Actinoplanes awajinensis]|uniref:Lipoprotein n=1 Tax=Actinoplanes awajinensis subsp. mycoplanecinus TaxID=135947 RepID=A0A101JJ66_9ACTN|nr:hypothetical protein [Actinoplanes awajinensis]KUL27767.1 hypothetical protein ADL15_33545 [Actinoplanes awajinensis subsp. mycoplanecinus]
MPKKFTLACALALGLLSGCSGNAPDSAPEVVSLQSPGGPVTVSSAATQAAPVIRPDTTFAEEARMQQPWMQCLKSRGVPMRTTEDGLLDLGGSGNSEETNGRLIARKPENEKACGKLRPVLAPELDEEKNPYYADDDDNYHKCLVAHGEPLIKKDGKWQPGPGWNDWTPDEAMGLACQAAAFDGKRG